MRIEPDEMAQIYVNRAGKYAVAEVMGILKYFQAAPLTVAYWDAVLASILRKRGR